MSIPIDDKLSKSHYNSSMDIKNALVQLGFSPNEANVYIVLLKLGLTQAGPVIKAVKLHRMLVYNALDRLVDDGLVTVMHRKNIKLFQASDPSAIIDRTKKLDEMAHSLVPKLRNLQLKTEDLVTVRTLVGHEGFITNLQDVIDSASHQKNKEMQIIGGAKDTDFYDAIDGWYKTYTELLEKQGVKKRLLAPTSYSSVFKKKFASEKDTELRTLPVGLSSPTYTRITEEIVSIELYHPKLVIIQIRNKAIARAYLDSFELLWNSVI